MRAAQDQSYHFSKIIFDCAAPGDAKIECVDSSYAVTGEGIEVSIAPGGKSGFPGLLITPPAPWNAGGYGHLEADAIDEKQFPADFTIDYVRVWQRADLATPEDGPKPNDGGPAAPKK